jgi:microcystin-dependent protein
MNAASSTNPATLLGFGTWAIFGAGRMPVGIDSSDTDFDVVEETGGAKTHTLLTSEMPSHNHTDGSYNALGIVNDTNTAVSTDATVGELNLVNTGTLQATGGGSAHTIMNPYIVVHMWKRTA